MRIRVLKPGLQTTVQAGPRRGQRHLGVPASGAADPLSLALANRLVGNALLAPALETTLTGVSLRFESRAFVAVTGAKADVWLDGERVRRHRTLAIAAGGELEVGPAHGAGIDLDQHLTRPWSRRLDLAQLELALNPGLGGGLLAADFVERIDVELVNAPMGDHAGRVVKTRQRGSGLRLVNESGRFRFKVESALAYWTIRVIQLTPEEAAAYSPKGAESD